MTYKKMSKSLTERFYSNFKHSDAYTLFDVYDKPSKAKQRAYQDVFNLYANDTAACDFRIISANSFVFTVAWLTGNSEHLYLRVETPENSYIGEVTDM